VGVMDTQRFFAYSTPSSDRGPRASGFLETATGEEWDAMLTFMQTRHLRPGETALTEGDIDCALYLLSAGSLQVRSTRTPITAVNAPVPLNELAFLDGGRCAATVRATTDSELLRLSRDAFLSLGAREPHLARLIALDLGRIVARRLRSEQA
jgi:CRP/FNR family transcriptional regulator, cyclic AMP receptor protein